MLYPCIYNVPRFSIECCMSDCLYPCIYNVPRFSIECCLYPCIYNVPRFSIECCISDSLITVGLVVMSEAGSPRSLR